MVASSILRDSCVNKLPGAVYQSTGGGVEINFQRKEYMLLENPLAPVKAPLLGKGVLPLGILRCRHRMCTYNWNPFCNDNISTDRLMQCHKPHKWQAG